jgi:hypothetical protein
MARRADPERIHQARRAAVRNGLTDYGVPLKEAERWCDAWELGRPAVGYRETRPTGSSASSGSRRNAELGDLDRVW